MSTTEPMPPTHTEAARTDGLTEALERVLPGLESFLRFEQNSGAARRSVWLPQIEEPLPAEGVGADEVLRLLDEVVIANGLPIGHPGFTGWVTVAPTTITATAALVGAFTAPQRWWVHPANSIEDLATRWLRDLLTLPPNFQGVFVSGGAVANLVGLAAARQHAGERLGIDISRDGIGAVPSPRIYATTQVHDVIGRAAGILGIGRDNVHYVDVDDARRPNLDALRQAIDEDIAAGRTPVAVVASAGDVNTGLVDPIDEMRTIAHDRGIWFHADGAYGALGILDERVRHLYGDFAQIDSLAVDPHKWLATPVGTGAAFVRDADILGRALTVHRGDYAQFQPTTGPDPGSPFDELGVGSPDFGVDFSTPSRGLAVWALLKEVGASGIRARIGKDLDCARRVADHARREPDLELLAEPVLSICCFRFRPDGWADDAAIDALNDDIVHAVRARGRAIPSTTRVRGHNAIRPCFINPRGGLIDADALVDEVLTVGRALVRDGRTG
ncbi:MAG: aminotransferase class V-fold PLP-dependent enzyme [Chloroflexota bacterium]